MNDTPKRKIFFTKSALTVLSVLIAVSSVVGVFRPEITYAIPVERLDPTEILLDQKNTIKNKAAKVLLSVGLGALMQGVSYFTRKLAYDTAKWVASGGQGQSALAFQSGFGHYLEETTEDAIGEAIYQLGQPFGLNLCSIPDAQFNLFLTLSIQSIYGHDGPQSNCTWTEFRNNWSVETLQDRYGHLTDGEIDEVLLNQFVNSLSVEQSDFGIAIGSIAAVDRARVEAEKSSTLDRQEGNGFKGLTDLITGDIRTPAAIVQEESTQLTAKHQSDISAGQIAGVYGSGTLGALTQAGSVFLNTLTSELLNNLLSDGLLPPRASRDSATVGDEFGGGFANNRNVVQRAFNFLLTSVPDRDLGAYEDDLLGQFAVCPNDNPGVYNCVIDSGLQRALQQAKQGDPVTIKTAIEEGMLDGGKPLIPPDREVDNANRNCYQKGYCYSNIQKLRKARILPLGFEIAAKHADPDTPANVTLQQVVDGFEQCNSAGGRDAAHPYCHLIDPNWVIKMPPSICEALVYGDIPLSDLSPERQQECADLASCVLMGDDGECLSYGYCLQEENVWNMPGDACPAEYSTCTTYVNQVAGTIDSYLSRTVDFAQCDADTVGCRSYTTVQLGDNWLQGTSTSRNLKRYGNDGARYYTSAINGAQYSCSANAAGCTEFTLAESEVFGEEVSYQKSTEADNAVFLKAAPAHLTCYDSNLTVFDGIQRPTTVAQAEETFASAAACADYAPACIAAEVGCHEYTPKFGGGIPIPAKVGANSCNAECAGYDTFRQLESEFEPAQDGLHFIPSRGESCTVDARGCSEFTNIDSRELGGEGLEYFTKLRHCELPNDQNEKVFYSWEGSESDGYVLRVHTLAQFYDGDSDLSFYQGMLAGSSASVFAADGAPKYAARTRTELEALHSKCNEGAYAVRLSDEFAEGAADAACRALYDDAGTVYYRMIDEVTTVSNSCALLRKTDTHLVVDEYLTSGNCVARGGTLDEAGDCNVCRGGGIYENGACMYRNIPGEGATCEPQFNGCREYVGNTGTNVRRIPLGSFESASGTDDWDAGTVVDESIVVGFHSLRVDGFTQKVIDPIVLQASVTDAAYEISFWARGIPGQQIAADFVQDGSFVATFGVVSLGNTWREYRIGPIAAADLVLTNTTTVRFRGNTGRPYFIDNIDLHRTVSYSYLIKDSWRVPGVGAVPLSCDSNPDDAFAGEALGCREYTDENDDSVTATGFEQLCRDNAIGCSALYDTNNNEEEVEVWYNAVCTDDTFAGVFKSLDGDTCELHFVEDGIDDILGSCDILAGEDHCYIDKVVWPAGFDNTYSYVATALDYEAYFDEFVNRSTIVVPPDTAEATPIFLSNQPKYTCAAGDKGCEAVALETPLVVGADTADEFEFNEVHILNLPDKYAEVLCTEDGVGCSEYQSESEVSYFKDPAYTGNALCEYRDNVEVAGATKSGWYKVDVGVCTLGGNECTTDEQCSTTGDTCGLDIPVPCYDDYQTLAGEYGIWSNETTGNYEGYVGVCEPQYHACTELIDRADVSQYEPAGKPYYIIFNDDVRSSVDECDGVSLKEGCVLLDETSNPNKPYNTAATYVDSENKSGDKFGFVDPNTDGDTDANVILKVQRDRQCSESLQCVYSRPVFDDNGEVQEVCQVYDVCRSFDSRGNCSEWVDKDAVGSCSHDLGVSCYDDSDCASGSGVCEFGIPKLTEDAYTNRDTSWYGTDYSGYSILDSYSYSNFVYLVLDEADLSQYVGYRIPDTVFEFDAAYADSGCVETSGPNVGNSKLDWTACGIASEGRCFEGMCVAPVEGNFDERIDPIQYNSEDEPVNVNDEGVPVTTSALNDKDFTLGLVRSGLIGGTCKAHPEENAPFPGSVLLDNGSAVGGNGFVDDGDVTGRYLYEYQQRRSGFINVNVYQDPGPEFNRDFANRGITPYINSCMYTKIKYQNALVDYWPINSSNIEGVCSEQSPERSLWGKPCNTETTCGGTDSAAGTPGTRYCSAPTSKQTFIGTDGFCLERDISRPINGGQGPDDYACLTWLPIQTSASRVDVYNNHIQAGYYPVPSLDAPESEYLNTGNNVSGGELYCLVAEDRSVPRINGEKLFNDSISQFNFTSLYKQEYTVANHGVRGSSHDTNCYEEGELLFNDGCIAMLGSTSWGAIWINAGSLASVYTNPGDWYPGESSDDLDSKQARTVVLRDDVDKGSNNKHCRRAFFDSADSDYNNKPAGTLACGDDGDDRKATKNTCKTSGGTTNGAFKLLVCSDRETANSVGFTSLPTLMKFYGWSFLAQDSIDELNVELLRVEYAEDNTPNTTWGHDESGPGVFGYVYDNDDNAESTFALVPSSGTSGGSGGHDDFQGKLYMHPPRVWRSDGTRGIPSFDAAGSGGVSSDYHSAEAPNIRGGSNLVYQSSLEASLTEDQLHKVYFLPMRYPGKYNGSIVPAYFTQELYIDFEDLRGSSSENIREEIERGGGTHGEWPNSTGLGTGSNPGKVISYRLERDEDTAGCGELIDSCDYNGHTDTNTTRNRIATRYVVIYTGNENAVFNGWDDGAGGVSPFSITCDSSGSDVIDQWFAIGMDFNANGEFLGYISRSCVKEGGVGMQLAVYAKVRNMCSDFAQVYDSNNIYLGTTNKAWTNKVWQNAPVTTVSLGGAHKNHPFEPFGSLPYSGTYIDDDKRVSTVVGDGAGNAISIGDSSISGTLVSSALGNLQNFFVQAFKVSTVDTSIDSTTPPNGDLSRTKNIPTDPLIPPQIYATNPVTCKVQSTGSIARATASAGTDTAAEVSTNCTAAAKDSLTVNGKIGRSDTDFNADGVPDEDQNRNGIWDGLYGVGQYPVVMQFFAFADHDRMPLRSVAVDWGDGRTLPKKVGYFRNTKPVCGDSIAVKECIDAAGDSTQLTCGRESDCTDVNANWTCEAGTDPYFGNQNRACSENFFEQTYTYTCTQSMLNDPNIGISVADIDNEDVRNNALLIPGVDEATLVCQFTPRVQATDNWGWCNGTCDGTEGCYEDKGPGFDAEEQCSDADAPSWTEFGESIIVIPR